MKILFPLVKERGFLIKKRLTKNECKWKDYVQEDFNILFPEKAATFSGNSQTRIRC